MIVVSHPYIPTLYSASQSWSGETVTTGITDNFQNANGQTTFFATGFVSGDTQTGYDNSVGMGTVQRSGGDGNNDFAFNSHGSYANRTFASYDDWGTAGDTGWDGSGNQTVDNQSHYNYTQQGGGEGFNHFMSGRTVQSPSAYGETHFDTFNTFTYQQFADVDYYTFPQTGTFYGTINTTTNHDITVITGTSISAASGSLPFTTTIITQGTTYTTSTSSVSYTFASITFSGAFFSASVSSFTEFIPEKNITVDEWAWYKTANTINAPLNTGQPYSALTDVLTSTDFNFSVYPQATTHSVVFSVITYDGIHWPTSVRNYNSFVQIPVTFTFTIPSLNTTDSIGYDPNSPFLNMSTFRDTIGFNVTSTNSATDYSIGTSNITAAALGDQVFTITINTSLTEAIDTITWNGSDRGLLSTTVADSRFYLTTTSFIGALAQYYAVIPQLSFQTIAGGTTVTLTNPIGLNVTYSPILDVFQYSQNNAVQNPIIVTDSESSTQAGFKYQIAPHIDVTDPIYMGIGDLSSVGAPQGPIINQPGGFWHEALAGKNIMVFMSLDQTSLNPFGRTKYSNQIYTDSDSVFSLDLHDTKNPPYNADNTIHVFEKIVSVSADGTRTFTYVASATNFTDALNGLAVNNKTALETNGLFFPHLSILGGAPRRLQDEVTIAALGVYDTFDANGQSGRTTMGNLFASSSGTQIAISTNLTYFQPIPYLLTENIGYSVRFGAAVFEITYPKNI